MKRIFTQSEPVSLFSGISSKFKFNGTGSRVIVKSKKIQENPDFDKPLKQIKWIS